MPGTMRFLCCATACLLALAFAVPTGAAAPRPNVLLVLADDMGFADLHINHPAAGAPTPRLDQLARDGVRFTRHYAESSCSPARVALLTGRYPARSGFIPDEIGIPAELTTLPELFRAAGYRTHHIGKWHIGHQDRDAWPDRQGFDTWLGYLNQWLTANPSGASDSPNYQTPTHIDAFLQNERGEARRYPGHLTDVLTERAADIIRAPSPAPWFIYLAYSAPHTPIQPRADYAARFADDPAGRYRAMLAQLDDRVGDLLDLIEATGQSERTIIVFASDNGGTNAQVESNAPFLGKKTEHLEGGLRTPLLLRWPGRIAGGAVVDAPVSIMDVYPTLATLAGLPAPAGLDGAALFDAGGAAVPPPARELFWETDAGQYSSFAVLSGDGRWRLYKHPYGGLELYDLAADPSGHTRAADAAATAELLAAFQSWHARTAELDLGWRPRGNRGHGMLTGDRLQRTSALGDFTIGLGVAPDVALTGRQTLLSQPPATAVTATPAGVHIQVHEFEFDLPPLEAGRCTSLLLTGSFKRRLWLRTGPSQVEIYRDGRLVAAREQQTPLPPTPAGNATAIGHNAGGDALFIGRLSPPLYLNRRVGESMAPALAPAALSQRLCAPLNPP